MMERSAKVAEKIGIGITIFRGGKRALTYRGLFIRKYNVRLVVALGRNGFVKLSNIIDFCQLGSHSV